MRLAFAAVALILFGTACSPRLAVGPRGGLPRLEVPTPVGITFVAHDQAWTGEPWDLAQWVTPVMVELYNAGPHEVRVSYGDFALTDGAGQRFPALDAFRTLDGSLSSTDLMQLPRYAGLGAALPAPALAVPVAAGRMGFRGGLRMGPRIRVGPRFGPHIRPRWIGGIGVRPGFASPGGIRLYGGLRRYYGPGALYWSGPWIAPPGYGTWVGGWGDGVYGAPSSDVLAEALPEGVLPPGSRVAGFLYFRRPAAAPAPALDLAWELANAQTGAALGSVNVGLQVTER